MRRVQNFVGSLQRTGQFAPGKLTGKTIQTLTVLPTVAGSYTQTRSFNSHRTITVAITYNDRTSEIAIAPAARLIPFALPTPQN